MRSEDRRAFTQAVVAVGEFYGKELSSPVLGLWWDALERFDWPAVESAFKRHLQSPDAGQFMPKPADVIRMIEGTSIDAAQVAWAKVDQAMRRVGPYRSVVFDDPVIHRALTDMGGWIALAGKTFEAWPFVANEFRTRYAGYKARRETPDYPRHLIGICEAQNGAEGLPVEAPTLIGDPALAVAVQNGGTDKPLIAVTHTSQTPALLMPPAAP